MLNDTNVSLHVSSPRFWVRSGAELGTGYERQSGREFDAFEDFQHLVQTDLGPPRPDPVHEDRHSAGMTSFTTRLAGCHPFAARSLPLPAFGK